MSPKLTHDYSVNLGNIRLPRELKSRLLNYCKESGQRKSRVVRVAMESWLDGHSITVQNEGKNMTEVPPIEFSEFVWRCLKCGSALATFPSSMKCPHCGVTFERQLRDSRNFVAPDE